MEYTARVETILKRLAPLTHPKQRSNRLVSYESVAALHEARRKWCLFADRVLRKTFVLSDKNPVFGQSWTADQREKFAKYAVSGQQPIIPLVGSAAAEQELDVWPNGKLDPEVYRTAIRARFRAIAEVETSGQSIRSILGWLGAQSFQFSAADFVIGLMKASLSSANLD